MHLNALGARLTHVFLKHRSRHAALDVPCSVDLTGSHSNRARTMTSDGLQHCTIGILYIGEFASSHRWLCVWCMDCMGERKALRHCGTSWDSAAGAACLRTVCCAHGLQNGTVVHLGGDMSAEEPTRAPMAPDAHMDGTVPCSNALQKCRSGCVANINTILFRL